MIQKWRDCKRMGEVSWPSWKNWQGYLNQPIFSSNKSFNQPIIQYISLDNTKLMLDGSFFKQL